MSRQSTKQVWTRSSLALARSFVLAMSLSLVVWAGSTRADDVADDVIEIDQDTIAFEVEIEVPAQAVVVAAAADTNDESVKEEVKEKSDCASKDKPCDTKATKVATDEKPVRSSSAMRRLLSSLVPALGDSANAAATDDSSDYQATHRQVALLKIKPSDGSEPDPGNRRSGWAVKSFCLDSEDNLLVAVGDDKAGELQLIDADGERQQAWQLPVVPEAINVDPEGNYLVAGAGRLLKLDRDGQVLLEAESPLVAHLKENQDEIREQVIQQMKAQVQSYTRMSASYQQRIDQLTKKALRRLDSEIVAEYSLLKRRVEKITDEKLATLPAEEQNAWALRKVLLRMLEAKVEKKLTKSEISMRDVYRQQIGQFEKYAAQQGSAEPTEEQIEASLKSMIAYKSRIASISSAGGDFFVATGAAKGYGYGVWRFDASMGNPEKIVTELRGCCGQMDVQACESGLFVAENSRHQVRHFDFSGEKLNEWGSRAREGVRGFGSCCNPMNVAFGPDGTVYTAESNSGRIKRYSAEGELMALIGSVELVPGCKKVSIAVTQDQQRVYMLDITRNHIIVMEAKPEGQQVVSNDTVESAS
ncbi:MAG: hypothetical protein AAGD11_03620 [Planctomycetota bacterium]